MSNSIASFDEQAVKSELRELVRKTIEETINAMLDEEADQLVGAGPYERGFTTTSGQVTIKTPKLKGMRFATAVVERRKRRETSVEEAIIEMYLAGVSTRRIEDVSEILWGAGRLRRHGLQSQRQGFFKAVEEWRSRPRPAEYPYVYVDGIYLKAKLGRLLRERGGHGGDRRERGRLPRGDRLRRVVGVLARLPVVAQVPRAARRAHVRGRQGGRHGRLRSPRSSPTPNTSAAPCSSSPQRPRQGSEVEVGRRRRPCSRQSTRWSLAKAAPPSAEAVADDLESMRLKEAAKVVRGGYAETLAYCGMPREHWRRIRTNNAIERLNREMRRRTRVVGTFPDGKSALTLVAARLKYVADSEWGSRRYLDVSLLKEQSC